MVVTTEGSIERMERGLTNLDRMEEQAQDQLELEIRDGFDDPHSETRKQIKNIRRSRLAQQERLESTRFKLQQLENDLIDDRRTIEVLDDMLMELLEESRYPERRRVAPPASPAHAPSLRPPCHRPLPR